MPTDTPDVTLTASARPPPAGGAPYLVVVEKGSSRFFHLPVNGTLVIGRGPETPIRIEDSQVSRSHAQIAVTDGEVEIADLDSHNGTLVNGERIRGLCRLSPGDAVTIGGATLVLQRAGCGVRPSSAVEPSTFQRRVQEEIERAVAFERTLSVVALQLRQSDDSERRAAALAPELRNVDLIGRDGQLLLILLPELRKNAALDVAARLVARAGGSAAAGVAACPPDAEDGATLVAVARSAAQRAEVGGVLDAQACVTEIDLADRKIALADPGMVQVFALIRRLAQSELTVLILGETGSGKENAAFAVHHWSPRGARPFVTLNCAALQETLVESELFGYEKGAFSGATASKPGLMEVAAGGTVFLDEVGELSLAVQAKLLRALEARRVIRLGGIKEREIDLRVVAATNRDLEAEVEAGRFRKDLFFRLAAAVVVVPPLRDRPRDLLLLAYRFLEEACAAAGRPALALSPATLRALCRYGWPGNVRELKNLMEYAAAAVTDETLEPWHLPTRLFDEKEAPEVAAPAPSPRTIRPVADELRELERQRMQEALDAADGLQKAAAELIGMPLRTFQMKQKQYGLVPRRR